MKTNRKGRPTKRTPRLELSLLKSIEDGLPLCHAAAASGISYETFCEWRRKFPEFADATERAVSKGIQSCLKVIKAAATKGDLRAAMWLLEHRHPEHFAKSRIEVNHQGSVQHQFAIPPTLLEEIARARLEYERTSEA